MDLNVCGSIPQESWGIFFKISKVFEKFLNKLQNQFPDYMTRQIGAI